MAHSSGLNVVEISDPGLPVVFPMIPGPNSLWRDVKVYSTYAYAVSEGGGGIQVIDLSDVDNGVATLVNTVTAPTTSTEASHNVVIDEVSGYLYRCGGGSEGLRIYSLADPANPTFVGSWPDRYIHDAQVVTYTEGIYAGKEIAFVCSGLNGGFVDPGLDILDVTDKTNIINLSQVIYPNAEFSHQCWLSEDRQTLYLNDELDEGNLIVPTKTFVFDVSDLSNPSYVTDFTNGNAAVGHNLYVRDNLIYEANYRSGMRIFDATNPVAPVEIAYFDTYPNDDGNQFNGLWSVFPFFPSGTVIGSDLERGLFVWQVGDPALAFSYPNGQPDPIAIEDEQISVDVTPAPGESLVATSVTLHVDDGTGFVTVPTSQLVGGTFQATFPDLPCGEEVEWYITAQTQSGALVRDPLAAPGVTYSGTVGAGSSLATQDNIESDFGWTPGLPSDTATTGLWVRTDPIGTAAQPEDDRTPGIGTDCWVTGAGTVGGTLGEDDIDNGFTTLISPPYDLSAAQLPVMSYWRWFSNDQGAAPFEDVLEVSISDDGGANWVPVETVGPAGLEVTGGWIQHQFRVSDFVTPGPDIRLRFVAGDLGGGSIVEAAIDDIRVDDLLCVDCNLNGLEDAVEISSGITADQNMDGIPDSCQAFACPVLFIRGDTNQDLGVNLTDAIYLLAYLFSAGPEPTPIESGDVNGNGTTNVADAIAILSYLFAGGPDPAAPFPDLGCP